MTFYRANFVGSFSTNEVWNTGHWLIVEGASNAQSVAEMVADAYDSSGFILTQLLGTLDRVEKVSTYKYDTIGGAATDSGEAPINDPGTVAGAQHLPAQCSVGLTLRTGAPGGSRRGRMYLPLRAPATLDTHGLMTLEIAQGLADSAAAYFGALNVLGVTRCVVASRKTGEAHNITRVEVGNVVDTQRRRRNATIETRSGTNISQV